MKSFSAEKLKMFNSDKNSNTTDFDSYGFKKTSNQYIQNMIIKFGLMSKS